MYEIAMRNYFCCIFGISGYFLLQLHHHISVKNTRADRHPFFILLYQYWMIYTTIYHLHTTDDGGQTMCGELRHVQSRWIMHILWVGLREVSNTIEGLWWWKEHCN